VTIQQSELAQAMATGVVNAFMTSGSTGWDTKTYEYIKKFYDTQAWLPKNAVIVNQKAFDRLDDKSKKALLEAGEAAEKRGWALSKEKTQWYLDSLAKNGMEIIKPTPELMQGLDKVGDTMLAEWLKRAGPEGQQVIDNFRAASK
jgi:TRAP-type C4-dicarboxylate transport system substrate-binding protein